MYLYTTQGPPFKVNIKCHKYLNFETTKCLVVVSRLCEKLCGLYLNIKRVTKIECKCVVIVLQCNAVQ